MAASVATDAAAASAQQPAMLGWWAGLALLSLLAVLVAGAGGYLLGQALARQKLENVHFALRVQQQALIKLLAQPAHPLGPQDPAAALPTVCWQSDAAHLLVRCGNAGSWFDQALQPAHRPAWFEQPELQRRLATGQALAGLQVVCGGAGEPAEPPAQAWLVDAQSLLDHTGRFGGYVGTARPLPLALQMPAFALAGDASAQGAGAPPAAETAVTAVGALGAVGAAAAQPSARAGNETASGDADEAHSFTFTVSHDLRAPIRVVEGFTRIVKEDYGQLLDRVANDHLDRVLGAAARMNRMIDAALTLADLSKQPLARQPVNLSQMAHFVVDELQLAHPGRAVGMEIEEGLQAEGDPTLLRLVLENLLGNAWKYSERNPQAHVSLRSVSHGKGRAFVVRDNGAGFDMRSAERLFGLFQRLHSASEFPGHGVGLASVRRIVRRHGGDIWAEGEPARGAAFTFTLSGH